jgi:nitrate/TMAO reductase-like tetraheme cytochrome c subunit
MHGNALLTVGLSSALVGAVTWNGFDWIVDATSTTQFCLSCHEMRIMQEELSQTIHAKNRAGVPVQCADCHVPKGTVEKLVAKIQALDDIYGHLVGVIDTPEKFEARREDMAHAARAAMRSNRSQACRRCHNFEAMDFSKQGDRARRNHNEAMNSGESCVDCHKGVAHKLPPGFD